jgi:hypothetical protein
MLGPPRKCSSGFYTPKYVKEMRVKALLDSLKESPDYNKMVFS